MTLIKAAVCHEFGAPLTIETVHLHPPVGDEVEVTLKACAICHSDLSFIDGGWGGKLPAVFGHEAAGVISAVGPNATRYQVGDPVLVTLIRACGCCSNCASGAPVACTSPARLDGPLTTIDGAPISQGLDCAAFAEKLVVDPSQISQIPDTIPMEAACLLSCGVITGIGAVVNSAKVRAGQNVVVIGAGGVGLNAIQGARIAGAAKIVAVDVLPEKLDDAREFGATDTILASDPKPWNRLRKLTGGKMADAVLVTVGAIPVYETASRYLAMGGKLAMVGMPHSGEKAGYEPVITAATSQQMIGSKMGDTVLARDIPWMIDLYQQGRLKLDELISGRWSLDHINDAITDTRSGTARRNVIIF